MSSVSQLFADFMTANSPEQSVAVLAAIITLGLALAKVRFWGVSLGVAFVFFLGLLAGHIGFSLDHNVLLYTETFGLAIFVYALGLQVGPGFFNSLRQDGMKLNLWGLSLILVGTILTVVFWQLTPVDLPEMMGIYCGATTNTPALGAAQQTLKQFGLSGGGAALGCAITYPLGVVGVILAMILLRKFFIKGDVETEKSQYASDETFVALFDVVNPGINGKTLGQIADQSHLKFIVSRVWRGDEVIVPSSSTVLLNGDSVLSVTTKREVSALEILFGRRSAEDWNKEGIDWNKVDGQIESRTIVLSNPSLNGKRLGHLHLGSTYGVNISRVTRGDIRLLATYDLQLQYGDRLTTVGKAEALDNAAKYLGNAIQNLNEPNLGSIFLGILLGLGLGAIPISLPGISIPVKLGMAGGPIIVG
ncbi:MAG: TrkA C-terminal domain-containing protein, partial [Bacteroidales bacterium]|nr:TrkA C-terminal domain-containing protein [Bacteroidales bacterium]